MFFNFITVPKNKRTHMINEELLQREKYQVGHQREEELHKLKVAEREWLVRAAEEQFKKASLEKESAEELLQCHRAMRELAVFKLNLEINKHSD